MIIRIYKIINLFAYLLILSGGIALFSYAFFILKLGGKSESTITNNVVARFDSPTEYKIDKPFWWFTKGDNSFHLRNDSDEQHVGTFKINFEGNPCAKKTEILISNSSFSSPIEINQNRDTVTTIKVPFKINPLSSIDFIARINMSEDCFLSNGDTRNLGAKVTGFKFE